jgi:hypothetical protein
MISLPYLFGGFLAGLVVTTIVLPPIRNKPQVPVPNDTRVFHTETGCVRVVATEVPCDGNEVALNFVAQHK